MRKYWKHITPAGTQDCPPDNTAEHVKAQVGVWFTNPRRLIHPEIAMEIAAWWHGPNQPGLTAFSHTGTITPELLPEIAKGVQFSNGGYRDDLLALDAYVRAVPPSTLNVVLTWPADRNGPVQPVLHSDAGRFRVCDPESGRYGYADLSVEWDG